MKYVLQAQKAYSDVNSPTRNFRESEYYAFARVTRNLHNANLMGTDDFPRILVAVHENQQLWNVLSIDVSNSNNKLPIRLKSQIFYLSEFIRFHTAKVIAKKVGIEILIEINMSIMRGLRTSETSTV